MQKIIDLYKQAIDLISGRWFESVSLLVARIALAAVFWLSARTKVEEGSLLSVSDTTFFLFEEEYLAVPLPPEFAAYAATYSEHFFPILLVLGLATRLGAAGLLGMTLVIQTFVYPDAWSVHILWAGLALMIITRGAGIFSLDELVARRMSSSSS